jgi:acetate kinase
MNTLVLIPGRRGLRYAGFRDHDASCMGTIRGWRWQGTGSALEEVASIARATGLADGDLRIAIRAIYGGPEFPAPVWLDESNERRLLELARHSPVQLSNLVDVAQMARRVLPRSRAIVLFETSFFVDLPTRERTYAVTPQLAEKLALRRWGYHGIFHSAAVTEANRVWRRAGHDTPARILSICLDPQPEVVGVLGQRPITVSSGATPLEGLPGETNSGEIDPSLALALAGEAGLGPEGANALLTGESGLSGLAGRRVRLDEVLAETAGDLVRVKEFLLYRILTAAGAAAAALGGVDLLIFSGRYTAVAPVVARELLPRLQTCGALLCPPTHWEMLTTPLERLMADIAMVQPVPDSCTWHPVPETCGEFETEFYP